MGVAALGVVCCECFCSGGGGENNRKQKRGGVCRVVLLAPILMGGVGSVTHL